MSGLGNVGPFSGEELEARDDHIEKVSGTDVHLSERELAIANEAFTTGRIYTRLGEEKETLGAIKEKLIQNCKRAVRRVDHETKS